MQTQPDFVKLWFDTFRGSSQPVDYSVRCLHPYAVADLLFVSNLLHDAEMIDDEVRILNREVVIPFTRLCWELGDSEAGFQRVRTHLEFKGVTRFSRPEKPPRCGFRVSHLWFSESWMQGSPDSYRVDVVGDVGRFAVSLDEAPLVRLVDQSLPKRFGR